MPKRQTMQLKRSLFSVAAVLALASPAAAQMYPGQDVTVNPNAIPRGEVLLYPGGRYMQVSPSMGGATIHLHMPRPHRHVAKVVKTDTLASTAPAAVETPAPDASAAAAAPTPDLSSTPAPDTTQAPPPSKPSHHKHAKVETASAQAPSAMPAAAQNSGDLPLMFAGDAPVPDQSTKPSRGTKVASAEPPPAQTGEPAAEGAHQNLYKHGSIMFTQGATDPSPVQFDGVKKLAADLNAALEAGGVQIQIQAYGGSPGDKSSDARRLSLKRALAVRQLLIDDGVPSARIDVRAMGGVDDKGPADRVDVYVRSS